ncbi:MAG TPA: energy transducer TonB [Selenomonadales bacterium]|nr:energy transducer TonB [Selenomonadales bacterium]
MRTEGKRWQKAVAVSLLAHVIVLTGLGWMLAKAFAVPELPEPYIELTLDGEAGGEMAGGAAPGDLSGQEPADEPQPSPGVSSVDSGRTAAAQTIVGSMTVVAAETGGQAGDSDAPAGGTAAGGAGNGTGTGTGPGAGNGAGSGPGSGGGLISPSIYSQVDPVYPEQARQAGREGTVELRVQILANGRPGEISVQRSSGWDLLDEAAVKAVRKWRFIPAKERDSGRAVSCHTNLPVVFRLKG